jgi:Ca2+-binding RTX toxin-like protein
MGRFAATISESRSEIGEKMRKLAGTIPLAALVVMGLMMVAPTGAGAATTIGQTGTPVENCQDNRPWTQPSVTSGASYAASSDGVISSWSTMGGGVAGRTVKLLILRPAGGTNYTVVQKDGLVRTQLTNQLNTFLVRIPIQANDLLGLFIPAAQPGGFGSCGFDAGAQQIPTSFTLGEPPTSNTVNFNDIRVGSRLNASAVIEPDCDNDGFGDETQDANLSSCAAPTGPAPGGNTCKGKPATIVGTSGNDVRTGSRGRDVIVGLGGNDTLSGVASNDVICGGTGKDKLNGGKGKDTLLGQKGRDTLKGGGAKDICKGGKGNDSASACEVEKSI